MQPTAQMHKLNSTIEFDYEWSNKEIKLNYEQMSIGIIISQTIGTIQQF